MCTVVCLCIMPVCGGCAHTLDFFVELTRPVLIVESLFWEAAVTPSRLGESVGAVASALDSASCVTNPSQEFMSGAPDVVSRVIW